MKTVTINGVAFDLARADHRDLVELAPPSVPADRFRAMAEAEKHLANLRRMHEHDQRHIARLSARIRKLEKDPAAHLFRGLE